MNERIRELVKQALSESGPKSWSDIGQDRLVELLGPFQEKVAELIIKECGQVLVDNTPVVDLVEDWDKGYDRAMNDCIHHIYEHFGVEE